MKNLTELLAVHFKGKGIYHGKNILNQAQILIFLQELIKQLESRPIVKTSGFTLSKNNGKIRIEYKDKSITLVECIDEIPFTDEFKNDDYGEEE